MKSVIALSALAAIASAQDLSSMPQCAQTCANNMMAAGKASELNCKANDWKCLCANENFAYGFRDCTKVVCNGEGVDKILMYASGLCKKHGFSLAGASGANNGGDGDDNGNKSDDGNNMTGMTGTGMTTPMPTPTQSGAGGSMTGSMTGGNNGTMTGTMTGGGSMTTGTNGNGGNGGNGNNGNNGGAGGNNGGNGNNGDSDNNGNGGSSSSSALGAQATAHVGLLAAAGAAALFL